MELSLHAMKALSRQWYNYFTRQPLDGKVNTLYKRLLADWTSVCRTTTPQTVYVNVNWRIHRNVISQSIILTSFTAASTVT
jgi:hypothetical protein